MGALLSFFAMAPLFKERDQALRSQLPIPVLGA
jgi:hypothetical protein